MTTVWWCEPRSHERNKAATRCRGGRPVSLYPIDQRLRLRASACGHSASSKRFKERMDVAKTNIHRILPSPLPF